MHCLPCTTLRQQFRFLSAASVIALAICAPARAANPGHEVIGDWKFTSVLDGVEISSIDEMEAQRLLGEVMIIRKAGTRFGHRTCGAPSFETQRVHPDLYVRREAEISAKKLKLPTPVTVVDLGCTRVFIKRPNHAVIFWDGFFFDAHRLASPDQHPH